MACMEENAARTCWAWRETLEFIPSTRKKRDGRGLFTTWPHACSHRYSDSETKKRTREVLGKRWDLGGTGANQPSRL